MSFFDIPPFFTWLNKFMSVSNHTNKNPCILFYIIPYAQLMVEGFSS